MSGGDTKFIRPGRLTRAFNALLLVAGRLGFSLAGSMTLTVVGRKSGLPRSTPVNPMTLATESYLVAARGTTEWVRNLRVAGRGELSRGKWVTPFTAVELRHDERVPILRIYIAKWAWEVGAFFGLPRHPTDEAIAAIADAHPVFRIELEPRRRR